MKKIIFYILILIVIFLNGCATKNVVYNRTIPEEAISILIVPENLTVVRFNDKKVKWKTGMWYFPLISYDKIVKVKIPEGENTLTINYLWSSSSSNQVHIRKADGIIVTYNFEAGKTYKLEPFIFGDRITILINKQ